MDVLLLLWGGGIIPIAICIRIYFEFKYGEDREWDEGMIWCVSAWPMVAPLAVVFGVVFGAYKSVDFIIGYTGKGVRRIAKNIRTSKKIKNG